MSMMQNHAPTVIDFEKTFKIIMDLTDNKGKISQVHITFAWLLQRDAST